MSANTSFGSVGSCTSIVQSGQAPALDTYVQNVAKKEKPTLQQLRKVAGEIVGGRVKQCGCYPVPNREMVQVVENEQGVHFSGLVTCGNRWVCPVCQFKILERKKDQLQRILKNAMQDGCFIGFVTLTIPHYSFQKADELRAVVVESYRKIRQSRKYRRIIGKIKDSSFGEGVQLPLDLSSNRGRKKQLPKVVIPEFVGDVRNLEVNHGVNGWHPHLHILLVAKCSPEQMQAFAGEIFSIWQESIDKQGYGHCSEKAFRYEPVTRPEGLAEYVSKWDIYREMTDTAKKKAKGKGRTPSQILADIWYEAGNVKEDKKLYRKYAKAFRKTAKLTINGELKARYLVMDEQVIVETDNEQERLKKLREEAVLVQDKTDEEIVSEKQTGEVIGEIHREVWKQVNKLDIKELLRDHFYSGGACEAFEVLQGFGVPCLLTGNIIIPTHEPGQIAEICLPGTNPSTLSIVQNSTI